MQEIYTTKSLIKKNILHFTKYHNISISELSRKTGISRVILTQNNGISEENIIRFLSYYSDIDANWLITGQGNMFKTNQNNNSTQKPFSNQKFETENNETKNLQTLITEKDKRISILEDHINIYKEHVDILKDRITELKIIKP